MVPARSAAQKDMDRHSPAPDILRDLGISDLKKMKILLHDIAGSYQQGNSCCSKIVGHSENKVFAHHLAKVACLCLPLTRRNFFTNSHPIVCLD